MARAVIIAEELSASAPLSWGRQYELAGLYSEFYRELTAALAPRLAHQLGISAESCAVLTREAVVPLGYLYLDRLLRLNILITANPEREWVVPKATPFTYPPRIELLQQIAAKSTVLAKALLIHQAKLWNLRTVEEIPPAAEIQSPIRPVVNNLFNLPTFWQKVRRVALLAYRRVTGPRKPIPVLSMGNSAVAFRNAGFYGTYFTQILKKVPLEDGQIDPSLRNGLRGDIVMSVANPLEKFLNSASFPCKNFPGNAILHNFVEFMVTAYPTSLFEKAAHNLDRGMEILRPFCPAPLIIGERGDLESAVLIAACKNLRMEAIDFQHGGHIGYLVDQSSTLEVEEYLCDRFISWGWTRYPDYPPHPSPPIVAMPNPWLSERAKLWRRVQHRLRSRKRPHDLLFFSGRVHSFPTLPSGAYQLTTDYLADYSEFLVALAREAHIQKQRIVHKPYNQYIAGLMGTALREMTREGGEYYKCLDLLDKGLTEELLGYCNVVLWDIPGTGFLECLAGGIPTLCCWPRLYNQEEPHAIQAFAALEEVGIVHRTPQTLFAESRRIQEIGSDAWMGNRQRVQAISQFSRAYGWADDNWADVWAEFLHQLQTDRNLLRHEQ